MPSDRLACRQERSTEGGRGSDDCRPIVALALDVDGATEVRLGDLVSTCDRG